MRDCDVLGGLLRNFITGGPGSAGCARDFLNVRKVLEPKKATFPLLELYCVQAMVADTVARALRGMPVTDRRFGILARMHMCASQAMTSLGTKLRLCPSSSRATKYARAVPRPPGPRPWEDDLE